MTPTVSMRRALTDPQLLGGVLVGDSWQAWRVLLIAAMGEALFDDERVIFSKLTGREHEAGFCVEELALVIGRKGGKSRVVSLLACYAGCLCKHPSLVPGEKGIVLVVAQNQAVAKVVLGFAEGALLASPILRPMIVNRTADSLLLSNGILIEVRPSSYRSLRGPTYVAAICDEIAYWYTDSDSANPDTEIVGAIRPALGLTGGPLIICSSPHAKRGVLWNMFKRHYGPQGNPAILVAKGGTRDLNPSYPQAKIDAALADDYALNSAEYLAEFRGDIQSFVGHDIVMACLGDHVEMAALSRLFYRGFVDPSGGSADSFTLAVSHIEGDRVIIDCVREITPPFSPDIVVEEYAALLKSYRITSVVGDRYGGEFPRELFRKHGIAYQCTDKFKSDLYRDLLPLLNSGRILLPKSERLVAQLVGLERKTARSGRDSIDHGPSGHDDLCNAVAGAASLALDTLSYDTSYGWLTTDRDAVVEADRWPPLPKRLHPNLSDQEYLRITQPPRLL